MIEPHRVLLSSTFLAAVIPRNFREENYEDFRYYEDFSEDEKFKVAGKYKFYDQYFVGKTFENKYFFNGFVKDSYFKDVHFKNIYFQYARFENVTFENVKFEWTEDWFKRAEFVNCRFVNTVFAGARFKHSFFHRCYFEGGKTYDVRGQTDTDRRYTFHRFYLYDTVFSHVHFFDTYWYRGEAYKTTFMYNRFKRFEAFETKFYSYYPTKVHCKEVKHRDFVYDWKYFSARECYAYVYRYDVDYYFDFDDKFYRGVGNDTKWYPSVKFYNCKFDYFKFNKTQMRAVEWMFTDFYSGTFHGDDYDNSYFYDQHFARCYFRDTDFRKFDFRGFTYFTGCRFDRFYFREMKGDRVYFYGSHYYHFYMHFTDSRFMYFDYGRWEHGYIKGRYDFFRFENMVHKYFTWDVERADEFEYCHVYYDNFKIVRRNVGEFRSVCDDEYHHKKELKRQFCYDYPYYYQCMHFRPYYRHYYSYDEFTCDKKTFTWWWHWDWYYPKYDDKKYYDKKFHDYGKFYEYDKPYYYDRAYYYDEGFDYDRRRYDDRYNYYEKRDKSYYPKSYDRFFYPSYDVFYFKRCYDRMYERYDQPKVVMREVDFTEPEEYFFGMPSTYKFYYDGVYHPYDSRYFWEYYWKVEHAFERKYYWFESFYRCFFK